MKIAVVHRSSHEVALGDRIRIEAIFTVLQKEGYEVLDVTLPSVRKISDLRENIFPPHGSKLLKPWLSHKFIADALDFVVSQNYLLKTLRKTKPDIVLAETTKVGWVTSIVAKKLSLDCIIDVHGIGFAEALGKGRRNWRQLLLMEKEALQNCDHIIAVSNYMKQYLAKKFDVDYDKMSVAPNGAQLQVAMAKYELPLKVIFAGSFAYWEKVEDVLEIARRANPESFRFYLAGAGSLKSDLLKRIEEQSIPITYLGYIPREQIYTLFSKMQIGLAPSTRDLARQVASPIKIFDYMSCGLPVLASKVGDWGELISNEDCGIALENDSVDEYLKALDTFTSKDTWERMSHNAITGMHGKYSWERCLKPIVDAIETLN